MSCITALSFVCSSKTRQSAPVVNRDSLVAGSAYFTCFFPEAVSEEGCLRLFKELKVVQDCADWSLLWQAPGL